ncbi:hypothetical protein ACWGE1_21845 [Streptomyces sp. NPDC054932]
MTGTRPGPAGAGGGSAAELTALILGRVSGASEERPAGVLDPEALDLGQRLWAEVGGGHRDVPAEAVAALGVLHWLRYLYLPHDSDTNDLETALHFFGKIAAVAPEALPARVRSLLEATEAMANSPADLMRRATEFLERAKESDDFAPAETAVDIIRRARTWVPRGHPARPAVQEHLAIALYYRYERTGRAADIQAAVDAARDSVAGGGEAGGDLRSARSHLGVALDARYQHTGDLADLHESMELGRAVVAACQENDPSLPMFLSNLCGRACVLYRVTGRPALLDEAIDAGRRAAAGTAGPGPSRSLSALGNLAAALRARFTLFHRTADLDEAVATTGRAVLACPPGHPDRRTHLANHVDLLSLRSGPGDLDEAITTGRLLLDLVPAGHPGRPQAAANVGLALRARYTRDRDRRDLDEGVALEHAAYEAVDRGHPRWAGLCANRAMGALEQFRAGGENAALDEAFSFARAALEATHRGDPSRAWRTQILALLLETRASGTGSAADSAADAAEALRLWDEASRVVVAPVRTRVQSAVRGGEWAVGAGSDMDGALGCYTRAVQLLDRLAWRGLERGDRETALTEWPNLTPDAVATALAHGSAETAIRLAEQGRAVLWSQLLDGRAELAALREHDPWLADRLARISAELG